MIILFIILSLSLSFAINITMLFLATRLFRVVSANWRTSAVIFLLYVAIVLIVGAVLSIIINIIGLPWLDYVLSFLAGAVIFHLLLARNYQTDWKKNLGIFTVYLATTIIVSLAIILFIRAMIFEPFYVEGATMEPTYKDRDYLIINKTVNDYRRGDVVVLRYPQDPEQIFIKRIVGLPGEKIQIKDRSVLLFTSALPEGLRLVEEYLSPGTETYAINEDIIELSDDEYYVLGDNRNASKDSRSFGPVTSNLMIGKVWFKAGEK